MDFDRNGRILHSIVIFGKKIADVSMNLIFPPRCPICDRIVKQGKKEICESCRLKVKYIREPRCLKCGKQLAEEEREYCRDCSVRPHLYRQGRALYDYSTVAGAIYRFKYKGKREYAEVFGEELAYFLGDYIRHIQPDALIPVPMYATKERVRGYNQAKVLAKALGKHLNIPVETDLVRRVRNTRALKTLNSKERLNNLKNAFILSRNSVKLKTIIIVDDIYTTGSTIDAMSEVLLAAGVRNIYYIALAIGEGI